MQKAIINRGTLLQSGFDSGRLTPLCLVIHKFQTAGEYLGTVLRDDRPAGNFRLSVNRNSTDKQVNIDLAALPAAEPRQPGIQPATQFTIQPGGNVVFYVSRTQGGNAVVVHPAGAPAQVVFDSRALDKGDVFLVTLLRPGQYQLTNTVNKIQSQVKVAYPVQGAAPLTRLAVQTTNVGQKQFGSTNMELEGIQGLAVRCDVPSRLQMQISQAIDRPPVVAGAEAAAAAPEQAPGTPAARPGKVTWRKPLTGHQENN
jgi:hypothetical protein